jgi:hypothetical protein
VERSAVSFSVLTTFEAPVVPSLRTSFFIQPGLQKERLSGFYSRPPHRKFASCRVSRTDRDVLSASKSHTSTVELQRPESLRKRRCGNKRKAAQKPITGTDFRLVL